LWKLEGESFPSAPNERFCAAEVRVAQIDKLRCYRGLRYHEFFFCLLHRHKTSP